ncbi:MULTISPECIES: tRNA guanosine(34) transglycosylase Tgt [Brevibacterium]|uniref:Queuine tRNA-ribosyltransferase n=2 Tax=Brevibacterium TaxID=1696 RepID=A0A150H6E6_9MICO|nr:MULTISPECIES: tRNA guanosine(34) transglycosylase Tgt [Brevibacterium]KXZ57676.1 Queuine tRNA-ribosyltransferase [Brevibacterium ravenspurgense]
MHTDSAPGGDSTARDGTSASPDRAEVSFGFTIESRLDPGSRTRSPYSLGQGSVHGRTGVIRTPHGDIQTPAFIPVGTKATVKAVRPEEMRELGAQALLANAYHLYLQPGADLVDEAGGLAAFMNWHGPTFTDSGGFQVMSLGSGFKKVISMEAAADKAGFDDDATAAGKERLSFVDDDGVNFKSHLDGSLHRFTPEISMRVQHQLGADIMFAFDELTTLMNSRAYQEESLERTRLWAIRCIEEHKKLTAERSAPGFAGLPGGKPYQALFGVIQGAQYEDLRRKACRDLGAMDFDGYGIGGALEKESLGTIVGWCNDELPEDRPRHLLGISEPNDMFTAVRAGADTFDCVQPSRVARNGAVYTAYGRYNVNNAASERNWDPIEPGCECYTCQNYSRAYLRHLFKAKEMLFSTLCTIHNEHYTVRLVEKMREAIADGTFDEYEEETLGRFYGSGPAGQRG